MRLREQGAMRTCQRGVGLTRSLAIFYGLQRFAIKFTALECKRGCGGGWWAGEAGRRKGSSSRTRTECHRRTCKRNKVRQTDAAAAAAAAAATAAAAAAAAVAAAAAARTLVDWTMRCE
jgi:hypothetical protein